MWVPIVTKGAANSHHNQARTFSKVFPRGEPREGDPENRMCQGPEARKQKVFFLKGRCFVVQAGGERRLKDTGRTP